MMHTKPHLNTASDVIHTIIWYILSAKESLTVHTMSLNAHSDEPHFWVFCKSGRKYACLIITSVCFSELK